MPANKRTSKERLNILRNASNPFIIHLEDEPYTLTEEVLNNQVDTTIQKKRTWVYPAIKFISFKDKILKLRISHTEASYEMSVKIEPDKLHISCSCGSPVQTLCNHSYQTLIKLISFERADYFKSFSPNGLIEIALANKKHFKIKRTNTGLYIKPAETLGSIYKIDKMGDCNFPDVLNLPQETVEQELVRLTDLTYIVLYSSRDKYFPFLLPCVGILNKAGTDIKGFYNFITGPFNEYDAYLTNEQKELNSLCLEMLMETKNKNGSIITGDIVQSSYAVNIFDLWNKVIPFLLHQPFVYLYNFYHKVQLKDRPQKGRLQRIILSRQKPHLYFQLIDKGAFYQLQLHFSIQGKSLKQFETASNFFICRDKNLYLLSSLRDIGITEWMRRCGNCITIFKEHFTEFKNTYLTPLTSHYRVETIPFKK